MSSSMLVCVLSTLAATPLPDGWQTRPLTDEDLIEFSSEELRHLRNEIYARHGYVFKSADLVEYFRQQPWYKPKPAFNPAAAGAVSPTEKANVELIKRIEDGRRAYETIDDKNQVFADGLPVVSEVSGALATIKEDGSLQASPHKLTVQLSCRLDAKTPTSKKCGCGHRLDIYDHRLRIRVASDSTGLPLPYTTKELFAIHCSRTLRFRPGLLALGDSAGHLLEIEYFASDDRDPFLTRKRYFALSSEGAPCEVADIEEGFSHVRRDEIPSSGNLPRVAGYETYFQISSHTNVDVPHLGAEPPTLRLTTHTNTTSSLGSDTKKSSKQEIHMLEWSAGEKKFTETAN